ncbi:CoA ester lyase [Salinadaptatus halalkaliphilus]|uniref:CoA ester lyase n=1 Tax=Salinadaptatus halalkaliphilus TaxID=2419781 RepID=A0A4S3THN1_9EURY|nr:CoA ester lyase [Salinadaptatus halalkaliphilus]THE63000.1 CoA ester lyase [Salinadaptatus halalkaliphilus]
MARRSLLFAPGDQPELLRKTPATGADTVIFDLEDAVTPDQKDAARATVRAVLADPSFDPDCEVCVRVNPTGSVMDADLEGLFGTDDADAVRPDSILLPKVDAPADIRTLAAELETYDRSLPILALLESAAGILAAADIAAASATDALVFGAEDFSADIGATRTDEGTEVLHAREQVVLAASAHEIDAVDTVVTEFDDPERVREEADFAVQLGYDGKIAIHPSQVDPINSAFSPSAETVEWAQAILEAKRDADADDRGVFEVDGEMIDPPVIAQAKQILERASAADRNT